MRIFLAFCILLLFSTLLFLTLKGYLFVWIEKACHKLWQKLGEKLRDRKRQGSTNQKTYPENHQEISVEKSMAQISGVFHMSVLINSDRFRKGMIQPFPNPNQEKTESTIKYGGIVCNFNIKESGTEHKTCPENSEGFIPAVNFDILQGVVHFDKLLVVKGEPELEENIHQEQRENK